MDIYLEKKIKDLTIKTRANYLSSETLYSGKFIELVCETYKLPNDKILFRERIKKNKNKDAVIIISITNDNKFILVVQNRIDKLTSIEFPSGYIEDNETIEEAAYRELREETGYESNEIIIIDNYMTQLGIDASVVNIVLAKNCIKTTNQNLGINEYINYDEFTFDEVYALVEENIINGCGNKLAFYELLTKYQDLYKKESENAKINKKKVLRK